MNRKPTPLNILMIEDSPMDAELVKLSLKKTGIENKMHVVDNIDDLKKQLHSQDQDIVLSDCMVPGVSVEQVLRTVRDHDEDLPFIALSGEISEEDAVNLLKSGAQDFINKNDLSRLAPAIERELHEAAIRRGKRTAEISLARSEERFQLAMQASNDGLWDWDLVNNTVYYSQKWLEMFGLKASEVDASTQTSRERVHPEDVDQLNKEVNAFIKGDTQRLETELRMRHRDGHYIDILLRAFAVTKNGRTERVVGTNVDISEIKRKESELEQSKRHLRSLASHLLNVREEEKASIAREIHDELGASLTALNMDIRWLDNKISGDDDDLRSKISSMSKLVSHCADQCGRIVSELRPTLLDDLGLMAAIEWQAKEFTKRFEIPCHVTSNIEEQKLTGKQSIVAYRILQESLTNIARHSQADSVEIIILKKANRFYLQVADNGVGISNETRHSESGSTESFGLKGMNERALSIDGSLNIESEPGIGTRVILSVPLSE